MLLLLPLCRAFSVSRSSCLAPRSSVYRVSTAQQQRSQLLAPIRASEEQQQAASAFDYDEPETAKEGIDLGLVLCKQGRCAPAAKACSAMPGQQLHTVQPTCLPFRQQHSHQLGHKPVKRTGINTPSCSFVSFQQRCQSSVNAAGACNLQ